MLNRALVLLLSVMAFAPAMAADRLNTEVTRRLPALLELYKDLHQNPELGFQEQRTAARLAGEMRQLGFTVTEGVGKTGIVASFDNGRGPTIMVRTELDALPLEEKTGLPYSSKSKQSQPGGEATPVMHACGHDIHMAAWLGTAQVLIAMKDQWRGKLLFIGQPAEESLGGAKAMLADGLFTRFPRPDVGFALHVSPAAAGLVSIKPGVNTSASDSVEILFRGRGGHGSMPSATIDPIVIASRFVTDVQSIVSREKDAAEFGVVTVGAFHAGTVANIIPDSAVLKLTLRSYSPRVREQLLDGVRRTAMASAMIANAPEPQVQRMGGTAAVISDEALANKVAKAFQKTFGSEFTFTPANGSPVSASEDYSEFIAAGVPSLFFGIGASDPAVVAAAQSGGPAVPVNHSPYFAPLPEPTIRAAVRAMTAAVLDTLQK